MKSRSRPNPVSDCRPPGRVAVALDLKSLQDRVPVVMALLRRRGVMAPVVTQRVPILAPDVREVVDDPAIVLGVPHDGTAEATLKAVRRCGSCPCAPARGALPRAVLPVAGGCRPPLLPRQRILERAGPRPGAPGLLPPVPREALRARGAQQAVRRRSGEEPGQLAGYLAYAPGGGGGGRCERVRSSGLGQKGAEVHRRIVPKMPLLAPIWANISAPRMA